MSHLAFLPTDGWTDAAGNAQNTQFHGQLIYNALIWSMGLSSYSRFSTDPAFSSWFVGTNVSKEKDLWLGQCLYAWP